MKKPLKILAALISGVAALTASAFADVIAEPSVTDIIPAAEATSSGGAGVIAACIIAIAVIIGCIVASVVILKHFFNKK